MINDSRSLLAALVGDGRSLLTLTGLCLGLSGGFAIFQSITGHFLPHDTAYLGMSPRDLCQINECRIVHFMIHDRISFGGALLAIAIIYLWLAEFPLQAGETWAWWTLLVSGVLGFGSFLTYLGYGYLDSWHGVATLCLLPCFARGLVLTRRNRPQQMHISSSGGKGFVQPRIPIRWNTRESWGHMCLLASAIGLLGAGLTIQLLGMTTVFVPTDLTFMGLERNELNAINPRLIPLIAHDRAGFGGALATVGALIFASVWFGESSRSRWDALFLAGACGWSTSIGVHPAIGYTDFIHLAPAVGGACLYSAGLCLLCPFHSKPAGSETGRDPFVGP